MDFKRLRTRVRSMINDAEHERAIVDRRYSLWSRRPLFSCVPLWTGCRNTTCAWPADTTSAGIPGSSAQPSSCCTSSSPWRRSRRKSCSASLRVLGSCPLRRHCVRGMNKKKKKKREFITSAKRIHRVGSIRNVFS